MNSGLTCPVFAERIGPNQAPSSSVVACYASDGEILLRSAEEADDNESTGFRPLCADPLDRGGLVVVNAYAGSGKSTTLRLLAETHPRQKFLYLCFNKNVADAARQVFPSNVRVSTMHGVAYAAMHKRFRVPNSGANCGRPRSRIIFVWQTVSARLRSGKHCGSSSCPQIRSPGAST
jgi:hypothetical protein